MIPALGTVEVTRHVACFSLTHLHPAPSNKPRNRTRPKPRVLGIHGSREASTLSFGVFCVNCRDFSRVLQFYADIRQQRRHFGVTWLHDWLPSDVKVSMKVLYIL